MEQLIYLDHAAATPMAPQVLAAMQPYFTDYFYNPSALYSPARQVSEVAMTARSQVAHWLGARPTEIIFTAGGTEANNLAIRGIMEQFPDGELLVSAIEHEAVLEPVKRYASIITVKVTEQGIIDLVDFKKSLTPKTVLVSVMYANNEIGTIQPIKKISQLIEAERKARRTAGNQLPIYLHTDASQAAAYLDLHANRLGVDLMTLNAGKMYGPKQVGVLYVRAGIRLVPQIVGGGQERGLRSGTENVAGIVGLATALDLAQAQRRDEVQRLSALRQYFVAELKAHIPKAHINGSLTHRLPNNVHVTCPGQDNERLIILLDEAGILCAAGSACSAQSGEPSHVLAALGLDEASARASLRFTMGRATTKQEIDTVVQMLARIVR